MLSIALMLVIGNMNFRTHSVCWLHFFSYHNWVYIDVLCYFLFLIFCLFYLCLKGNFFLFFLPFTSSLMIYLNIFSLFYFSLQIYSNSASKVTTFFFLWGWLSGSLSAQILPSSSSFFFLLSATAMSMLTPPPKPLSLYLTTSS